MRLFTRTAAVLVFAAAAVLTSVPQAPPASAAQNAASSLKPSGYWTMTADGGVHSFGSAPFAGSASGSRLNGSIIAATPTSTGLGYWLCGTDGGVFTYGDAPFFGSTGNIKLNRPVVGMAGTPSNEGYWFVATDGGVFAYGDAGFFGSTGSLKLNKAIVGMARTPSGLGYWLVASDGGIFSFGDAKFYGSTGAMRLNQPIVGMASTGSGRGYWLVASDGGIFSFGDAKFHGSTGAIKLNKPIVGMAATPSGAGYWLVASDGGVFTYGDATFAGSAAAQATSAPTIGIAPMPRKRSAETSIFYYPWYSTAPHDGSWRHWDQGGNTPPDYIGADYWPERGPYSSADASVVGPQMAEIKAAGIDTVSISWWGQGSWEDSTLSVILPAAAAVGLKVAIHIEPYPGRTAETIAGDYAYLMGRGIRDFYIYEADRLSAANMAVANDSLGADVRVWAEAANFANAKNGTFAAFAARARFTGIYTYAAIGFTTSDFGAVCGTAHANGLLCSPSVFPGFVGQRATPIKIVTDRQNGATYDRTWQGAINAGADVISITSYNEWHEGSQIEASVPHCLPDGTCLKDYVGAYGSPGDAADSYIDRTAMWTARLRQLFG